MMVKMKTTLGMETLLNRCSVTSTVCAIIIVFSYDLIQLKFYWRNGTAFSFSSWSIKCLSIPA